MGSEIMTIPEVDIPHVITVLQAGMSVVPVPAHVEQALQYWCQKMDDEPLPRTTQPCILEQCVYNGGLCWDPDTHHGNSDARCHCFSKSHVRENFIKESE